MGLTGEWGVAKRTVTTKDVGLILQLIEDGQIQLAPEFQRNSVWPRPAKAYLIDTILCERPMPLFFFQRGRSAQTGKSTYTVVDGQQRLRAILEFVGNKFPLSESKNKKFKGKKYADLSPSLREQLFNYDLNVEELTGYSDLDIRNIFVRMNRFVVKLSPQELRHARESGKFYNFVEDLGGDQFWSVAGVFSKAQNNRMKATEFSAEIAILLIEGPQDKKTSVDLYYQEYRERFAPGPEVKRRLKSYLGWISDAIPSLRTSRFRKPTDLYGLIGALDVITDSGTSLSKLDPVKVGKRLREFEAAVKEGKQSNRRAIQYAVAASRQTDNIIPRQTRIDILTNVILGN